MSIVLFSSPWKLKSGYLLAGLYFISYIEDCSHCVVYRHTLISASVRDDLGPILLCNSSLSQKAWAFEFQLSIDLYKVTFLYGYTICRFLQ